MYAEGRPAAEADQSYEGGVSDEVRRTREEQERGGGSGGRPRARHSGRCWRRNCSISATSSEAGGKSSPGDAASGSSSTRLSSFFT